MLYPLLRGGPEGGVGKISFDDDPDQESGDLFPQVHASLRALRARSDGFSGQLEYIGGCLSG